MVTIMSLDCGPLTAPTNGKVDTTEGTKYQSVAVFSCNDGYNLVGTAQTECAADATWDTAAPTCVIKSAYLHFCYLLYRSHMTKV